MKIKQNIIDFIHTQKTKETIINKSDINDVLGEMTLMMNPSILQLYQVYEHF